jgi:hypothetical protein
MDTSDHNTATNTNSSSSNSSGSSSSGEITTATAAATAGASSASLTVAGDALPVQRPLQRPQSLESARREALGYLLSADAAFMRAEPEYRQCSDNHAHVCLDAAWLLFLTGDMTNLPQVSTVQYTNYCDVFTESNSSSST